MPDVLPSAINTWHQIESAIRSTMHSYGYEEIRTPLVEKTELFKRGIGEATDIVEKEMYSFDDRKGESLTLRPENTASCVRAAVEGGLLQPGSVHAPSWVASVSSNKRGLKSTACQVRSLRLNLF